jgi:hypothetical protein
MKTSPTLKSKNMQWLVACALFDASVVLLFIAPELINTASVSRLLVMRGVATALLPTVVLLLTGLLSHDVKAMLVFWKIKDPLPGCEAFSRHAPADARIDMAALRKNVGALPTEAAAQNALWYKLYRMVSGDRAVEDAHRLYLLYRDIAAISVPLIVLVPIGLRLAGAGVPSLWGAAAFFLVQFLVSALGARHSGHRFVCNVLSVHSTNKITAVRTSSVSAKLSKNN